MTLVSNHAHLTPFSSPFQVWDFLHKIYGGGPRIKRRNLDIYGEEI